MQRPDPRVLRLGELASETIRTPSALSLVDDEWVLVFDPPLTSAEQAALDALQPVAGTVNLSVAGYQTIRPDIEGLRTYVALPTPTAAQTAQATKAIIRILRAVFRD